MRPLASLPVSGFAAAVAVGIASHSFTTTGTPSGGFAIPAGTPDGVYSVRLHPDGTANHTLMAYIDMDRPTTTITTSHNSPQPPPQLRNHAHGGGGGVLSRRGTWGIDCGGRGNMDPTNACAAVDGLASLCGGQRGATAVGADVYVYALRSSMAAFFCVFAGPPRACYDAESRWAFQQIVRVCGADAEGWMDWWDVRTKEYTYGYHNAKSGVDFCGRRHG
ncbi:hypothetical protein GGTG_10421 [Gaeumannomyces tritici R3-111a-1]|uniref:Uncharacterized protein n=1 Tax=Gaeumannomyces tritici (strain R3-111a-1) TaxID=644352 RepID=J3PA95_GAET3|nr:hypothetical protein GGTG_10421 [Gaeumannomyces tritici R3-111a-1]EJT71161.1 hypothetical protein GGTG_10421 [Gaeumannomyces tritici R3-111a-1]